MKELPNEYVAVVDEANKVETQSKRKWHYNSERINSVFATLRTFMENSTPANLKMLSIVVDAWERVDKHEFKNCEGGALRDAIKQALALPTQAGSEKQPLKLENGDILFRYVPHLAPGNLGVKALHGQRGGMQGVISSGQSKLQTNLEQYQLDQKVLKDTHKQTGLSEEQLKEVFDTSKAGESADLIQHVGIYVDYAKFRGVVEIGGWGVYQNSMQKHGNETIDLVVRFENSDAANAVGKNAYEASMANREPESYPGTDFVYMLENVSTCGVMTNETLQKVQNTKPKKHIVNQVFLHRPDEFVLAQKPVCSHFVHAVLWASLQVGVTVYAATHKDFDQIFKISPFQLWIAFLKKQGVWRKAKAECVGIQQNGEVCAVTDQDLKDWKVAA